MDIANLEWQHQEKKICGEKQERCNKEKNKKKNRLLLTFFSKPQPKITQIPPNVWPSALVQGLAPSPAAPKATVHSSKTVVEPIVYNLLEKSSNLIKNLPKISKASDYDKLAIFAGNPVEYDNLSLSLDEL